MRLGLSSYTYAWAIGVPEYPPPPKPFTAHDLLAKAASLGVRIVQIADNLPLHCLSHAALDALARAARELHIDLEVGTCGVQPGHLRRYLQIAGELGSPLVRTVLDTDQEHPTPREAVAAIQEALPEYERAGVCLAIENHDRFPAATLAAMLQQLGSQQVGICLDTANSLGCGEGIETLLNVLGTWVANLHVKDFTVARLPHKKGFVVEGCPAGQGQLNIPQLLARLREAGRQPNAILELWPPPEATPETSIAKEDAWATESIRFLRQFLADY